MTEPRTKSTKAVALIVSGIGVAIVLCIGGAVAISAPKFMRFQDRSWQSECKTNLRGLLTAERSLYGDQTRYSSKPSEVGFSIEKGNRYQYRLGPGPLADEGFEVDTGKHRDAVPAALEAGLPPELRAKLGVQGTCPTCEVTATCVGNVDSDDTLDVWSVTLGFKKEGDSYTSVAGELVHHVDDTEK